MAVVQNPLHKYKILIVGAIVLSFGVGLFFGSASLLSPMALCGNPTNTSFVPGRVIEAECRVVQDVGQDLTFRAAFYSPSGSNPIAIPAHLEIRDPDNEIVFEDDFNELRIIVSLKPDGNFGTYTATLSSLEDGTNRIHRGQTSVAYEFGFLTNYSDVHNPLGKALLGMIPLAAVASLVGIGIVIYGAIKAVARKA